MAYSPELERILKEKGIKVGNRVRVEKNGHVYEGLLMPRIEVGDEKTLIIKLDSGYNVGIKYEKGVRIEKVGEGKEPGKIPRLKIRHNTELPDVVMIATGGTIGTHVDYLTGGVYMCRDPEEILFMAPEVTEIINLKKALRPFTLASEDMTPDEWKTLAKLVAKELNEGAYGVIITHGTDTMHYTSAALSFMLSGLSKPVVLTGAQRSTDRGSADSAMNLICSAHASISDIAEVGIVMHAETDDSYCFFIRGTKARKMHTTMRNTFRPINDYPIAKIWPDGKVEPLQTYKKRTDGKVKADTKYEPNVALVKAYPNSDPTIIDYFVKKGCKGIIIEGTGLGHVPTQNKKYSWIPHVKEAVNSGVFIGIAPQTLYGKLNPDVYANGRILAYEANAVHLKDMLPETAYVKLGWVLGHTKSMKKKKDMMLTNYAGEFKERLQPDMFLY